MKRVTYGFIILIFVISITFFGLYSTKNKLDYMGQEISYILDYIEKEDFTAAGKKAKETSEAWIDIEDVIKFFVQKDQLDEITFNIVALESLSNSQHSVELRAECEKIIGLLNHIWDREKPSLHNIL